MFKNNILACIGQVILAILTFLFLTLIHGGEHVAGYFYSGIGGKIFFILVPALYYWLLGKLMSRTAGRSGILLPGLGIVLLSLLFGFIGFSGLGSSWREMTVGQSMWRLPLDLFLLPQMIWATLFNLPKEEYVILLLSAVPGLIFTLSLLDGKRKINRRKRMRKREVAK